MPFLAQDEHLQACFRDLSLRVATLPLPGRDRWLNWLPEQGWGERKGISEGLQVPPAPLVMLDLQPNPNEHLSLTAPRGIDMRGVTKETEARLPQI